MLKDLFRKSQYATVSKVPLYGKIEEDIKPNIPTGMWNKCPSCGTILYSEDLQSNFNVCVNCNYHFRMKAKERIIQIFDKNSFSELYSEITTKNPLNFEGYQEKIQKGRLLSESEEAVVVGIGKINELEVASAVMDSYFMMGSMGSAVGEKITRIIEYAIFKKLPLIIVTTSGGARMQEGIFSLMQMAKVSAALGKLNEAGLLYITVITNPTTGGVTASFAMEGDIIISEPGALVGFAGRRVIENTIKETLPDNFQKAEFLQEKGFIDIIINRKDLRKNLYKLLCLHGVKKNG